MSNKTLPFLATLIRGNVYFLGNTRFDVGVPVAVTKAQRDRLEEDAVDVVNAEGGETFTKPKFEFDENPDYVDPTTTMADGAGTGGAVIEGLDTDLDDNTGGDADEPDAGAGSKPSGAATKPATRTATRRS